MTSANMTSVTKSNIVARGHEAIDLAESGAAVILCKFADPFEDARTGLAVHEATEVAREDASLIYAVAA